MSNVLYIGDVHAPFTHANYLKFVKSIRDKWKCDRIVFIGDIVDNYAHSRFAKDPDTYSAVAEYEEFMEVMQKWYEAFPEADWILGNHDTRPFKKAKEVGLGRIFTESVDRIYGCPSKWNITPSTEIDGVMGVHGMNAGGASGWQEYCKHLGQSVVIGHMHSIGGVRYHQMPDGTQLFTMSTSCGVDDKRHAFAYGKAMARRPLLGCGVVLEGKHAYYEVMDLSDRKWRRIR